jgi:hypothetical protein
MGVSITDPRKVLICLFSLQMSTSLSENSTIYQVDVHTLQISSECVHSDNIKWVGALCKYQVNVKFIMQMINY